VTRPPRRLSDDYPEFAPDGSFIAFERCGMTCRILTVRPDGTGLRQVGPGCTAGRTPPRCSESSYPAISPDGRRIAFMHHFGRVRRDQIDHVGIYVMRADGSRVRRVTLPRTRTAEDGDPQWSPDGSRILFRALETEDFLNSNLFTIGADGTGLQQVTDIQRGTKLYSASFSPDGTSITFGRQVVDGAADVFTMRLDGTGVTQLTRTRLWDSAPDWGGAG
jgi:Tol biopolymer transport system component